VRQGGDACLLKHLGPAQAWLLIPSYPFGGVDEEGVVPKRLKDMAERQREGSV
jgi:hypothetical protein